MTRPVAVPTARDLMTSSVVRLRPEMPVLDAVAVLHDGGFSGAPVVDAEHRLVGVLSELDTLRVLASAAFHDRPTGLVADRMSTDVVTVAPEDDVFAIVGMIEARGLKRLPVVEHGRVVGLVSRGDVMDALADVVRALHPRLRRTTLQALQARFGRPDPTA